MADDDGVGEPVAVRVGPARASDLAAGSGDEWLLTDGLGGYACGTATGLRTRRYHGLLVVATHDGVPLVRPGAVARRHLALAALDPVLVTDRRVRLATAEWASGAVDPAGQVLLAGVEVGGGVVRHRWAVGDVVLEREVAMLRGRPAVAVVHRVVTAPSPVGLELAVLATWRDAHGDRDATGPAPDVVHDPDGARVEGAWRVRGAGFVPAGAWFRGVRYREEAARGLRDTEDLWHAGTFTATLAAGAAHEVTAWAGAPDVVPPPAAQVVADARRRAVTLRRAAGLRAEDDATARGRALGLLVEAADHHVTAGPGVVAGFPWFGEWSRDTMTAYEGLFLATGRVREGAALLRRAAASVSAGMLPNTCDGGHPEYDTADATLWFVHAIGRHLDVTGDEAPAVELAPVLRDILAAHCAGTRFGIGVDADDGLLRCGTAADAGVALTWMDARVDGVAVTPRHGKPVEVNALWVNALAVIARVLDLTGDGEAAADVVALREKAVASFRVRFVRPEGGLRDVVDSPVAAVVDSPVAAGVAAAGVAAAGAPSAGRLADDDSLRPNQLLAVSLPYGPLAGDADAAADVVRAVAPLVTPLGLRSLAPDDPGYLPRHRGGPAERDRAYHRGTVWPWLIGPYVDALRLAGATSAGLDAVLDGLVGHLGEAGLGSVSETADGAAPHGTTGCPFQAWSVAELLRVLQPRRVLRPLRPRRPPEGHDRSSS